MYRPAFLLPGDSIYLLSTARKVSRDLILPFIAWIESYGIRVIEGDTLSCEDNQYAGTDEERGADFQKALDRDGIKAIWFAGGGYGSIRIFDDISWDKFIENPKWLIGFSDITIWHNLVNQFYGIQTIHALMPRTFGNASKESIEATREVLFGKLSPISFSTVSLNTNRIEVTGELIGGNLSILYSLLGTKSGFNTNGRILYIEDVGEYLYHIDRMMIALKNSGKLEGLKALIVGEFSDMMDNEIPFGKTYQEIIKEHAGGYGYPIVFDFPAGHISNNMPLILGANIQMKIYAESCELSYL